MKIGIAGAGIMGSLLAFKLQQAGHHVTLYDQSESRNCSMTAAGMLTPVTELEKNHALIYQMGEVALQQHWPQILQQLPDQPRWQQCGSLVLAHPRDTTDLQRFVRIIADKSANRALSTLLSQQQIMALEPEITKFTTGYFFPTEGYLDAQSLLLALWEHLSTVTWHKNIIVQDMQAGKIMLDNMTHHYDMVVDCRGLGAQKKYDDIRAVRGELILLHAPDVKINRLVRLLHPRYSLYIVPRANQHYLIGASEIEGHDLSPISVRTTLELLTAAYSIHPGFAEARIIETRTHCRPTLSSHLPKIKFSDGYVAINGLYRHGYLIAPTLAHEVMNWLSVAKHAMQFPQIWEQINDKH